MKRNIIICLILCFIAPVTIEAKKKHLGNGVYWELSDDGTLTISGDGRMPDFNFMQSKSPWYKKRDKIKYIIIEEGITHIADLAFYCSSLQDCYNIKKIEFPQSLKSIGKSAFYGTGSISKVCVPDIKSWCSIDFEDPSSNPCFEGAYLNVKEIGEIRELEIPDEITTIKSYAFFRCKNIISVKANSVISIGRCSFSNCKSLISASFSNSLQFIEYGAFSDCDGLVKVKIPTSVTKIGKRAFGRELGTTGYTPFNGTIVSLPLWMLQSDIDPLYYGISKQSYDAYKKGVKDQQGKIILAATSGRIIKQIADRADLTYYMVSENGTNGLMDTDGKWLIPLGKYETLYPAGQGYIKFKKGINYGILTLEGEEIVPSSRGYTSISEFNTSNRTFAFKKKGYSGLCNERGEEISTTRLAPTADDIKANGGFSSAVAMNNGSTKYYKVSKSGRYGLTDSEGREVIPCEMEALESAGTGYLRYKLNGFWGLMNYTGKVIIDTDRGYTSIGDYKSFNKRFAYTMAGYKGECDATGRQISKIKVETPKQNTSVASSSGSSSSSSSSSSNNKSGNNTTTIHVEHHHDPVPVQQWQACIGCGGMGTMGCDFCGGSGTKYIGDRLHRCSRCNGRGIIPCNVCYGSKGKYITVYQ